MRRTLFSSVPSCGSLDGSGTTCNFFQHCNRNSCSSAQTWCSLKVDPEPDGPGTPHAGGIGPALQSQQLQVQGRHGCWHLPDDQRQVRGREDQGQSLGHDCPSLANNSIFFCFLFCEKSLICLEGKSMTPHRGKTILFRSSQQLPRLHLGPSKGFLN